MGGGGGGGGGHLYTTHTEAIANSPRVVCVGKGKKNNFKHARGFSSYCATMRGETLVHRARVSSATVFTSNYTATRMLFNVDRNWFVSFLFVCFEDKQTEKMVPCSIYIGTR